MNPKIQELKDLSRITFDIETDGLVPCYDNRVTCICAKTEDGVWFSMYDESEKSLLEAFFEWLYGRGWIIKDDQWISKVYLLSKNGKKFDIPFLILRGIFNKLEPDLWLAELPHFDLQEVAGGEYTSLNNMCKLYNCETKTGNGKDALTLWKFKEYAKLESYCRNDVEVTEEVFDTWKLLQGMEE